MQSTPSTSSTQSASAAFTAPLIPTAKILLARTQTSYALGSAVTLRYALVGADRIPINPIRDCPIGESDFKLTFIVRDSSGRTLPGLHSPSVGVVGYGTLQKEWLTKPGLRPVVLNDAVPLYRPGIYTVVACLQVQRPAGTITCLQSEPLEIHLTDNAATKAHRQGAIGYASRLLQRRNTPAGDRYAAIVALRYGDDAKAIPVLVEAMSDPDMGVYEQAERNLVLWPDAAAALRAANSGLAAASVHPGPIRPYKWQNLLANLEMRQSFGAVPAPSAAFTEAQKRARQVVVKTILSGMRHLPVGIRADRMVELILFQEEPPTVTTLRPVLATASHLSTQGQQSLAWMWGTWEKRPVPASLRPLRTELERLAANAALHPDLRKAASKVSTFSTTL